MGGLGQRALRLAALGYYIFPLSPGHKIPPKGMAFKERATRDAKQIRAWWKENPNYNIGIYTGRFGDDEDEALFVLDVDKKKGALGIASLAVLEAEMDLPLTAEQYTASGGFHMIYRVPIAVKQGVNVFGPGLDVRSRGGYIVGPGSIVNGVEYTWRGELRLPAPAPRDLLRRLPPEVTPAAAPANPIPLDDDASLQQAMEYCRIEAEPGISGHGGNDAAYKTAAQLRSFGLSYARAVMVMLNIYNSRCVPPWPQGELIPIIQHAYQYAQNPPGNDSPAGDFTPVSATGKPVNPLFAAMIRGSQIKAAFEASLSTQWLIRGILPYGMPLAMIYGPPKSGKSFLTLDQALCIAAGIPWHGRKVTQQPVVYVAAEGQRGTMRRMMAWEKRHGLPIPDDFTLLPMPVRIDGGQARVLAEAVTALADANGRMPGLIVIDTLAHCMAGDENATRDMSTFVTACLNIHRHTGATILIIHHSGKDASKGARGNSALLGAVDLELRVIRENDVTTLSCTNARDIEPFEPIAFELESVETGYCAPDDELEVIRSLVPRLIEAQPPRELTAQQVKAFDVLVDLSAQETDGRGVLVEDWREACNGELSKGGIGAQRQAFMRARNGLVGCGLIKITVGRVRIVGELPMRLTARKTEDGEGSSGPP